jgi:hypothetical protein
LSSPTPPATYQLVGENALAVLDGTGKGTARWTPGQSVSGASGYAGAGYSRNGGYTVDITGTFVSVATNTLEASAITYITYGTQSFTASDAVGTTVQGSTGDTGSFTAKLRPGDWVTTVWTGGDVGAIATMKLLGTVNPPGTS